LLLLSLAAANLPQTAVLCFGDDGHIAIEPAGHDHYADGSHVHECGPGGVRLHDHSHLGPQQRGSCVDISVSVGTSDHRRARRELSISGVPNPTFQAGTPIENTSDEPGFAASASSSLSSFCGASLRCTVLQV
jgi:hypothetical protein